MVEEWARWERQVVNGVFPLRRFLGNSDHSGVFLTEYAAPEPVNAAIKLIPAEPTLTEATLWRWRMAATLSHPHLVRVFDSGRCRLGNKDFLFVVMELSDQNLAEILPRRPLTADEVAELLAPTLAALSFLHAENLVQGQLRPSNFLVVNDQLKLATDTVHAAGEFMESAAVTSVYDAPEAKTGRISTAADIWALGITMVEALTQHAPAVPAERAARVPLPAALPETLADTIRRCLSVDPDKRPTVGELRGEDKQSSDEETQVLKALPTQGHASQPQVDAASAARAGSASQGQPTSAPPAQSRAPQGQIASASAARGASLQNQVAPTPAARGLASQGEAAAASAVLDRAPQAQLASASAAQGRTSQGQAPAARSAPSRATALNAAQASIVQAETVSGQAAPNPSRQGNSPTTRERSTSAPERQIPPSQASQRQAQPSTAPQRQIPPSPAPQLQTPPSSAPSRAPATAEAHAERSAAKMILDTPMVAAPRTAAREDWDPFAPPPKQPKQRSYAAVAAVVLVAIAAIWGGLHVFRSPSNSAPSATGGNSPNVAQQGSAPAAASPGAESPAMSAPPTIATPPSPSAAKSTGSKRANATNGARRTTQSTEAAATGSPSVVHEEIPDVPRSARDTIHGHIKVAVRVKVDGSGNVIGQTLENPGPSKYFARLATEAARKWKFAAANAQQPREWLLRFEFSRGGATGQATPPGS
jgi:TonB family protein